MRARGPEKKRDSKAPERVSAVQLAIRFGLEIGALVALGSATAARFTGAGAYLAGLGAAAAVAVVWSTFAVVGDPSRSGKAPVPVPGVLRLAIELAVFVGGAAALGASGSWAAFDVYVAALAFHHAMTRQRVRWLLEQ